MWSTADDVRFSVTLGLRKGLKLVRGMRRALTEDEQTKVTRAIVDHLELSNWNFEHGPPREGHGPRIMPDPSSESS
jgi:hypothetical protein